MRVVFEALGVGARPAGTRTRLLGLLAELVKQSGHEFGVLHGPGLLPEEREALPEVAFMGLPTLPGGPAARLLRSRDLWRPLRGKWDVLVAECLPYPDGLPLIACVHDLRGCGVPGLRGRLFRSSLRRGLRRARAVQAVSAAVARELEHFDARLAGRVDVVPNGVDLQRFGPGGEGDDEILARHGVTRPYLLCVGHLEARKDPGLVLEVAQHLRQRGVELPALLVGTGPILPEETLCWFEGQHAGRPLGWCLREVPPGELGALYRGARAVIAPSRLEGFGMAPLEAAAAGTPVVASDIPAHREVLGAGALFCQPGAVDAFTQAVLALLYGLVDEAALVERAREAASRFTWKNAARRFLDSLDAATRGGA